MKKSVTAILVIAVLALFLLFSKGGLTGWQMLDLPAPPSPPGMGGEEVQQEAAIAAVEEEETPPEPEPPGAYEEEVVEEEIIEEPVIEESASVSSRLDAMERVLDLTITPAIRALQENVANLNAMESEVSALKVQTGNLQQRPEVQSPLNIEDIQGPIKRNLVLTVSFFVFVMLIITVMISVAIINRRNDSLDNKRLLRQYLVNYQNAGYRLDTLKMHLRACGWKDDFIEEVVRELPK
jgi:hypothetical protein